MRERLAVSAFADALESIPVTLAENSGMDPIDAVAEMQSKLAGEEIWYGVDCLEGRISDMAELDVYEPLAVKAQSVRSSVEAATMLLRIDDVISASKMEAPPGGPGGMPPSGIPGAGDMPRGPGGMPPGGMPPM